MKNNDFLLINDIIYKIYSTENFDEMRLNFLKLLNLLIPNCGSSILMANNNDTKHLLCNPVCYPANFTAIENTYLTSEEQDYSRWIMVSRKSMLIRETDLLSDEERINTPFFQKCYKPFGLYYSIQLNLVFQDTFLGVISLYRTKEQNDFTDDELFIMRAFEDHLNLRFFQNLSLKNNSINTNSLSDLAIEFHLTNREVDVLKYLFQEYTPDVIADKLCISSHTLKKHIQNIYRKFNISTRWELLKYRK